MDPISAISGLAREVLRLINNLIEGKAPEQREAEALALWFMGWPVLKLFLKPDQIEKIEAIMNSKKQG